MKRYDDKHDINDALYDWPENWLIKSRRGCGASHIRPSDRSTDLRHDEYQQQQVAGDSVSITCFVSNQTTSLLGFNRQLVSQHDGRWVFDGVVSGYQPNPVVDALLRRAVPVLLRDLGIDGLCTVDFIVQGEQCFLLEVNPRWGASMELYDSAAWVGAHVRGIQPPPVPRNRPVFGVRTVYSVGRARWLQNSDEVPDWAADLPHAGQLIDPAQPICSVHAAGADQQAVLTLLQQRARQILEMTQQ